MKHWIPVIFLLTLSGMLSAQQITVNSNGLYLDENNNLYTGIYKEYYPKGNIKTEMSLRNGLKDGITTIYFENGKKNEIRSYKKGEMHGTWITWNELGVKLPRPTIQMTKRTGNGISGMRTV